MDLIPNLSSRRIYPRLTGLLVILALSVTGIEWGVADATAQPSLSQFNPGQSKPSQSELSAQSLPEQPRFRMREDFRLGRAALPEKELPPAMIGQQDFSWNALTKAGPAAGAGPLIGNAGRGSFFDFKDGIPHPYFVMSKPSSD